ncbi:MAG: hypothetical protein JSR33_00445 [Proteobacteria bacterium]|nr:hypothetical protein [Pseudomonadota bacterium]
MKELLNSLKPHISTILTEMKKIGYDQVYIAEPMVGRPSDELTFLVESENNGFIPSQVATGKLRTKMEKLLGVSSCMIMRKSALEDRIKTGEALDQILYQKTLDSAALICLPEIAEKQEASSRKPKFFSNPVSAKKARPVEAGLFKLQFKQTQEEAKPTADHKPVDSPH